MDGLQDYIVSQYLCAVQHVQYSMHWRNNSEYPPFWLDNEYIFGLMLLTQVDCIDV